MLHSSPGPSQAKRRRTKSEIADVTNERVENVFRKQAWLEDEIVRFVLDWEKQMLAGNPVLLHEARRMEEMQVCSALEESKDTCVFRKGDGALQDFLLRATREGHYGMVLHHLRDTECRESLRIVLRDMASNSSSSSDSEDDKTRDGEAAEKGS